MKFATAKELFQHGLIKDLKLIKVNEKEWIINLIKIDNVSSNTLMNDKGESRMFKSLDAAYNVASAIGAASLKIDIPKNIKHNFDL